MSMSLALLHTGAQASLSAFSVHPSTVIGILGLAGLYEFEARRTRRDSSSTDGTAVATGVPPRGVLSNDVSPTIGQRWLYYSGLVAMFLSLNGPLHDLSDSYLFSAHMIQHLMLSLVVAPLMVMGTPGGMLRPALKYRGVRPLAEWLTKPTHTFVIYIAIMAGWHLPPMYNYALAHHNVHIVEHLMFLVASVLMWWPVLSPMPELPRLSYPGQMLYMFLLTIPMAIIAVYIAYADQLLYPIYATAPRIWGITPMNDQLIGGLIMWIPGGLYFYTVISFVFFKWQQRDGIESQAGAQVNWHPT
ncbi:MAG TPA: cytochrome c oxidase assembly protein [Gemmatimonadaceae bacterium]|jgi:putative membrane protein